AGCECRDAAEFADSADGLGVDVGRDVEEQIPRLGAHQIAGLSDPEPRCDAEGEDPRFPVLDDEAVALVLELLSRRPLLACRRHPLPLVVAARAQLWRRCRAI